MLFSLAFTDFRPLTSEVIFQPGVAVVCQNISIENENILEVEEIFVTVLTTNDSDVLLGLNSTTVSIQNDDCKYSGWRKHTSVYY